MKTIRARISGLGMYVPERTISNKDLETLVETSDEWIVERTGIRERHFVSEGQANSDLALQAAQRALAQARVRAEDLDLIIVATVTPDMLFPCTACLIQDQLGAKRAWAFDLSGACSGFLYALVTGGQFIETGRHKKVLVLGSDVMSSIIDFQDRATCVLFGDGAGAVVLEPTEEEGIGILDSVLCADGSGAEFLYMPAGGSRRPATIETVQQRMHFVHQEGKNVFKFAVKLMTDVTLEVLTRNGYQPGDIKLYVPHQANLRIINAAKDRLKLRDDQVAINIERYANTTAATIPSCLAEAQDCGRLEKGDLVVLASFGAGFTWGSVLLRWAI